MKTDETPQPVPKFRKDYSEPDFLIETVDLEFELGEEFTQVRARLEVRRNGSHARPLVLDGEELDTVSVRLDGKPCELGSGCRIEGETMRIEDCPDRFRLETEVRIQPQNNTALSGLYRTSGNFCTQCEANGFRRITWFLDRPDVMSRYRVTMLADRERYPVLLSNGNRVEHEEIEGGRTRVVWEDPYPKPCYLFALVAGQLVALKGNFTTASGRDVRCEIWVEPRNQDSCEHALASLKHSMAWDELAFGREYDLDVYMIVAVGDFNMGAMENKGLNVFNSKYVLARPETATDADYEAIEAVIGHEYFHNWTGNRITCRDWFQLTLKEGLTVYRDQEFTAYRTSAAVKRIDDVRGLRAGQFPEDGGPMAHPIRPESYIEMDNFYTATVYEKGAEVIRMYATLLGTDGFRRGMDLYFERHDGQAVTCDDFRAAMADANNADLAQFENWYLQAGTPILDVAEDYDGAAGVYILKIQQRAPEGQDAATFRPLPIPMRMGLLGPDGTGLPVTLEGESSPGALDRVIELSELHTELRFTGLAARPVPSLLRAFSAPVILRFERGQSDLAHLMAYDTDAFVRWDAGQTLFGDAILALAADAAEGKEMVLDPALVGPFQAVLDDSNLDGSMRALMLVLPGESVLEQRMGVIDPDALYAARSFVRRELASACAASILRWYGATRPSEDPGSGQDEVDRRRLGGVVLAYRAALEESKIAPTALSLLEEATCMTDTMAALGVLNDLNAPERSVALDKFYSKWKDDPLVMDKWFTLQACSRLPGAAARALELSQHADYTLTNPNRVRSVVGAFSRANPTGFHDLSGDGYRFLADQIVALDPLNPQIAARLAGGFNRWKRYDETRQALMRTQLERIRSQDGLSKNTLEIVARALE